MSADSLDELHTFAGQIGMRRSWFQNHRLVPHYDLTATRRRLAVRMGATETTAREVVKRAMTEDTKK